MYEGVIQLDTLGMVLALMLAFVPLMVSQLLRLRLHGQLLVSVGRMVLQLFLLGLLLEYLLAANHWYLTAIWLLVMLGSAAQSLLQRAGVRLPGLAPMVLVVLAAALGSVVLWCLILVIRPEPWFDARYLITLGGMILGNAMNGSTIALERLHSSLTSNSGRLEYETWLSLGATRAQALMPFRRQAAKAAMLPTVNSTATMGLVHIPGMMTGQILGGSNPVTAIAYQGMIMLAILAGVALSAYLITWVTGRLLLGPDGLLRSTELEQKHG